MSRTSISTPKEKSNLYLATSLCDGIEDNNFNQLITLLRSKDADPNVFIPLTGITPFHLVIGNSSEAFAEQVTKLFLRHGGNPNVKSVDDMTPVHIAAAWGRTKILQLLLANGGDPLCLDSDNYTPFHYALQGEHYKAVLILSKYCINEEDEDDNPKFKRNLDKILVNNGEVLAEYIVSDESSLNSSLKNSSVWNDDNNKNHEIETSGYLPENSSTDAASIDNSFVTFKRKKRKRVASEETKNIFNEYKEDNFDFIRDTEEEEMHLLNKIISELSSSVSSDVDHSSNTTFQSCKSDCLRSCKITSPKRIQITMTFNRPKQSEYYKKSEKLPSNKRNSTLQVIKQHKCLSHLKNNKIMINNIKKSSTISQRNLTARKKVQPLSKNVVSIQSKPKISVTENLFQNKWHEETLIISKSPNLAIDTQSKNKNKKFLKTPSFEKKSSQIYKYRSKKSPVILSNMKFQSTNKINHCFTPVSRIPRSKKYFTTSNNLRTVKRSIETKSRTVIPDKYKVVIPKKTGTNDKSKSITRLNRTYNKSEASTPSSSVNIDQSQKSLNKRKSLKNIAMNLNNYMYDEEDSAFKEKSSSESRQSINKYVPTFEREIRNQLLESELLSGFKMIDSEVIPKSESKLSSDSRRDESKSSYLDIDLNHPILDSLSSLHSKKNDSDVELRNFKNINESPNAFNTLVCETSSILSDSNDSFLSVNKIDYHSNLDNSIDNKNKDIVQTVSPESNFASVKDDFSSIKRTDSESFLSVKEEYKYEDPEEGIAFLERRLCVFPSSAPSDVNTSFYSCSSAKSEPLPKELFLLNNMTLRERLKSFGENPGPVTKTTHYIYLKRLHKLESQGRRPIPENVTSNAHSRHSVNLEREKELMKSYLLSIEWIKYFDDFEAIEQQIFQEFAVPNPSRKWREGTSKTSFNYLLLDPRITNDLPRRAKRDGLSLTDKWETFLSAIFYVGKGKKSRPYAHLYDAFKVWVSRTDQNFASQKIQRILDIWNEGKGVIVLHVFHNTIPVEAYTREALMIEVLGTQKLGNCKCGDYYGMLSTWRVKEKCDLGRYLLFKVMQILLLEGERQIFPDNL